MAKTPEQNSVNPFTVRAFREARSYAGLVRDQFSYRGRFGLPNDVPESTRRGLSEYVTRRAEVKIIPKLKTPKAR